MIFSLNLRLSIYRPLSEILQWWTLHRFEPIHLQTQQRHFQFVLLLCQSELVRFQSAPELLQLLLAKLWFGLLLYQFEQARCLFEQFHTLGSAERRIYSVAFLWWLWIHLQPEEAQIAFKVVGRHFGPGQFVTRNHLGDQDYWHTRMAAKEYRVSSMKHMGCVELLCNMVHMFAILWKPASK